MREPLLQLEGIRAHDLELQIWQIGRPVAAREGDHLRRAVDSQDASRWDAARESRCDPPVSAAHVEDAIVRRQRATRECLGGMALLHSGVPLVFGWLPFLVVRVHRLSLFKRDWAANS